MQCQSQLNKTSQQLCPLELIVAIQKKDRAWFKEILGQLDLTGKQKKEAFENIESMTIERFYNNYLNTNGNEEYRMVNIGVFTVDLKLMKMHLTADPDNTKQHIRVFRGNNHLRPRPNGSRFSSQIIAPKLRDASNVQGQHGGENWLGSQWGGSYFVGNKILGI